MLYKTIGLTDIYFGNALEELKLLSEESVHCVITSPPYFGLRSYLPIDDPYKEKEIGLEKFPEEYVANLVCIFQEVKRVLRKDGVVWLNLGDSYKDKQLLGIPWKVAFALQADGWYLRQDIIWAKKNVMPEAIKDRCTKSHEYVFLLTKSEKYFFDSVAIREESTKHPSDWNKDGTPKRKRLERKEFQRKNKNNACQTISEFRNKRSVWFLTSTPYKGAHFATMNPKLIEPCVLAGTSEKGCCALCGKPYVRKESVIGTQITKQMLACDSNKEGIYTGQATKEYEVNKAQNPSDTERRILKPMSKIREYTFEKNCKCETEEKKPCTVLDPFGGSGTTAWVANYFKRKAIVIELNKRYLPLIEERIFQPYAVEKKKKKEKIFSSPMQLSLFNFVEENSK